MLVTSKQKKFGVYRLFYKNVCCSAKYTTPYFWLILLTMVSGNLIIGMENAYSDKAWITFCVPPGSVLGSLFFLLYVNDMPHVVDSEILLYACDSCLVFQHMDITTIEEHLNRGFTTLIDWFVDNKLSV